MHFVQNILLYTMKCNFIHMSECWWGAFEELLEKITIHIQLCCKDEKNNIIMKDKDVGEYS